MEGEWCVVWPSAISPDDPETIEGSSPRSSTVRTVGSSSSMSHSQPSLSCIARMIARTGA